MPINYGQFAPGLAAWNSVGSAVIDNVLPNEDGSYRPMSAGVTLPTADALPSAPRGQISFPNSVGAYLRFIATGDTWYAMDSEGGLTSIGTGYAVTSGDKESFVRFGSYLIGSNVVDGMRQYNAEIGGSVTAISGAPDARFLFVAANHVFALDCDGNNRLMRNSDANDHTNWTGGLAEYQSFEDGGALIGGCAISQGAALIFQREAVRILTFNTSGPLYNLTLLANTAGAVSASSIVPISGGAAFMDTDGPKFASSTGIVPLGDKTGVANWFLSQTAAADLVLVDGAYDRFNRTVWWRYRSGSDAADVTSRMLGYHIDSQRFTTATIDTSAIFSTATVGYTLDTMDSFGPLDTIDIPLDDRFWKGGEPLFGGMDADFKFFTFSGLALAATLETPLIQMPRSMLVNRATPIDDATGGTVELGVADRVGDALTWKSPVELTASGSAPLRGRGRAFKLRRNIPAGAAWSSATGFDYLQEMGR